MGRYRRYRHLLLFLVCALLCQNTRADGTESAQKDPIARETGHVLLALPFYTVFDYLTFQVHGNDVTLTGQVTRPVLKSDAEKAVRAITGVQQVTNNIEVLPFVPSDDKLRLAIYAATYGQLLLNQYEVRAVPPVHIVVKNGNVTLEGAVNTQMDKETFFTQASAVPGVVSVTDHVRVAP